jgi:hypothetical protein
MSAAYWPWWIVAAAVIGVGLWLAVKPIRRRRQTAEFARAQRDFHKVRERLEAKFFQLAGACGKPRGLRWTNCDFDNDVAYARDRKTSILCAFVGVTISFEAIPGGGMEDVEAVSNLRAATSTFRYVKGRWDTDGRALFNLNPVEAIAYYRDNLTLVGREPARS